MKKKRSVSGSPKASHPAATKPSAQMPVVHPHAAGIDIGATSHWVCVPADAVAAEESPVREFGASTPDLNELVEWLLKCGIETVAMESTSVYWIPLFQKLEASGIEALLVNARHVKNVPGRKTDCKDCQWLQRLHSYGLLSASFRPADDICRVRTLMRHRDNLTKACGQQVQHMQKALNCMNIHLHHAVSDLHGETGLRILDAILAGERDPKKLVLLRDPQITRSTIGQMEAALTGDWREEELFVLRQSLENYRHLLKQMDSCEGELQKALAQVTANSASVSESERPKNPPAKAESEGKPKKRKKFRILKAGTGLKRDLRAELIRICGVDLTQVAGLNALSVLIIISEIGVNMARWRSPKAFASWLGLCPREQNQRRQSPEQPHRACREPRGHPPAQRGASRRANRHLARHLPSPHEIPARSVRREHRHRAQTGLHHLSPPEIQGGLHRHRRVPLPRKDAQATHRQTMQTSGRAWL